MKLGVSSYSFNRYLRERKGDYADILRIAKEIGFDGVEFIGLVNESWGQTGDALSIAKAVKGEADALGLEIPAYTVGANLLADDPEAEVSRLFADLEVAKALGAGVLRHDASFSLKKLPGYTWESGIVDMIPYIRRVADQAASLGIRTCSENHGKIYQDAVRVEELIRRVGHPNYGWLVDIGNFICTDNEPLASVKLAAPYAVHAHAKDFILKDASVPAPAGFNRSRGGRLWRGTTLGHGDIPVAECIAALVGAGYSGWLSLEFEGHEENLPALAHGFAYLCACLEAACK